jgi:hypothetical protein
MHAEARRLLNAGVDVEELRRKGESTEPADLHPWHITNAVSHCGAGCTLGDAPVPALGVVTRLNRRLQGRALVRAWRAIIALWRRSRPRSRQLVSA